jgi:predicted  nucleic acid-binding Zn ribbon protein
LRKRNIYDAIDRLWLDSGDYEAWAKAQLSDITSPVNISGMRLRAQLDAVRRCYVWYFQDQSDDGFTPITHCPQCGRVLTPYDCGIFAQLICEPCGLITVGD